MVTVKSISPMLGRRKEFTFHYATEPLLLAMLSDILFSLDFKTTT